MAETKFLEEIADCAANVDLKRFFTSFLGRKLDSRFQDTAFDNAICSPATGARAFASIRQVYSPYNMSQAPLCTK